jgi:uncharacterized protein YcbK (DUF882 family)
MSPNHDPSRRSFLKYGLAGAVTVASLAAKPALAAIPRVKGLRTLAFHNLHTDERLRVRYWKNGKYDRAECHKINHILRDFRSGDAYPMDVRLFDLMYDLQRKLGHEGAVEIISGYRSPHTNMMLASQSDGVAKHSYHTKGMAIDIRMPGVSLPRLHNVALAMRRGGVGYYPDSQFVHMDVGPLRRW